MIEFHNGYFIKSLKDKTKWLVEQCGVYFYDWKHIIIRGKSDFCSYETLIENPDYDKDDPFTCELSDFEKEMFDVIYSELSKFYPTWRHAEVHYYNKTDIVKIFFVNKDKIPLGCPQEQTGKEEKALPVVVDKNDKRPSKKLRGLLNEYAAFNGIDATKKAVSDITGGITDVGKIPFSFYVELFKFFEE